MKFLQSRFEAEWTLHFQTINKPVAYEHLWKFSKKERELTLKTYQKNSDWKPDRQYSPLV